MHVKAHWAMTGGTSRVENKAIGCKVEMWLDSSGPVRDNGEGEAPPGFLFYLEPALDVPKLTLEGAQWASSPKHRL